MKDIKINAKGIAFVTSIVLGVAGYSIAKADDFANRGDSIVTKKVVNMRLGPSTEYFKVGEVPKNAYCNRIISINGFDLVRYGDRLIFVSDDYTNDDIEDYNNEYYYIEEEKDLIKTTTEVNFRLGPSTNEDKICLLDKGAELTVIGKSTSYSNPEDVWYLAKYKDEIGFVKAQYTKSLRDTIQSYNPNITDIEIDKMGYVNKHSYFYDNLGVGISGIDAYQLVKVLGNKDNNYIIEYAGKIGIVPKDDISTYDGTFVVVDLSDQIIQLYCKTDNVFESVCTTGWDKRPTDLGAFTVYERTNSRYFSPEHEAKIMWANFDHGNGIHDAPWEENKYFGSNKYRKKHGSNGCVRLPDTAAMFLKSHIRVGTKVLIKK